MYHVKARDLGKELNDDFGFLGFWEKCERQSIAVVLLVCVLWPY